LIEGESTAQTIGRKLREIGVCQDDICSRDVMSLYQALNSTPSRSTGVSDSVIQRLSNVTPKNDQVWAVIVETRKHPALEFVVCQLARRLNIGIQIFHGQANKNFITRSAIRQLIDDGQVYLTDLGIDKLRARMYNSLLLSEDFWNSMYGRNKILIFQTDSVLCESSKYRLEDFLKFDYIGSKWDRKRPVGIVVDGGNGGLSLRDWQLSKQCLKRFSANHWPGGEDGYFAFHLDLMGANVARTQCCAKFSSQFDFSQKSFGGHSIHNMNSSDLKNFLHYSPEAQNILV
jgi:hypothetical protein